MPDDNVQDLPVRQITRLRSEMDIASAQMTSRMFPDMMLGIEYGIVARICLPDWARGGELVRPAAPTRGIAIRQMALSLGGANETTRRRAKTLIELGGFEMSAHGVSLAATPEGEAMARRYYLGVHDRFVRLIEDVHATCDIDIPTSDSPAFGIAEVIERAIDTLLLPIDTFHPPRVALLGFLLQGVIKVAASRRATFDPELCRRYGNLLLPDAVRTGISLRKAAAAMSIPYATAWRHACKLEQQGLVTRLDSERWTVSERDQHHESMTRVGSPASLLLLRKIRELAAFGLDPARAAAHYRVGRPPLVDFGSFDAARPPDIGRGS